MKKLIIAFLLVLLVVNLVYSQEKPRTAVIPFNAIGVAEMESLTASNLFETALVQTDIFLVIEQTQIAEILDAQSYTLSGCTDESCAVEIGKLLSAEQIVLGSFSKLGSGYVINAKIIDVTLGRNIRAEKVSFSSMDDLVDSVDLLAYKLAGLTFKQGGEDTIASVFGELFISTVPSGADIYVNGVKKGTSPDLFTRIPAGLINIAARSGNLFASEDVDIGSGTSELTLELKEVFGNLFVKSSKPNVEVYLDDRKLGPLGDGFFRNLPIGEFDIVVKGENLYWEGTVSIREGESVRIEAYPRATGSIVYNLPTGAEAEIHNSTYRELISGRGELKLWEGKYEVKIFGEHYKDQKMQVVISQGSKFEMSPDLEILEEYKELYRDEELFRNQMYVLEDEFSMISFSDISDFITRADDLLGKIESSAYPFPSLKTEIRELIVKAGKKQLEFNRLEEIQKLTEELKALEALESKGSIFKYIFGGLTIASLGGSGVSFILGNDAFSTYENAATTGQAIESRKLTQLYDTITLSAGAGGIVFSIAWLINLLTENKDPDLIGKITDIKAQLAELEAD